MIAKNIQARRASTGLSQEQLAERVGVSRQTVAKWESGESSPDLSHAAAIARELDVSLDQLIAFDAETAGYPIAPKGKHIFGTVTVGDRGQIVIPKAARDVFAISPGDSLVVLGDEDQGIAIMKADEFMTGINALVHAAGQKR